MRALILLGLLGALPALAGRVGAEEPDPDTLQATEDEERRIHGRYMEDALVLCRERVMSVEPWSCDPYTTGASLAATMETLGLAPEPEFALDSRIEDPTGSVIELRKIARECREETMDGKLVDGLGATLCIEYEVGLRNWEARRAKRLKVEE